MQDHENDPLTPEESNLSVSDRELLDESTANEPEVEDSPDTSKPALSADEEEELPKEESPTRRGFRKFIRWTFGLMIIFGLGFLTAVIAIYNPKVDELDQIQNDLDNAETTIQNLDTQISNQQDEIDNLYAQSDTLNLQIDDLEKEKQALSEDQIKTKDDFKLHIALLKTRMDISNAHIEIYEGNIAQARVLLSSANQGLTTIESLLSNEWKEVIPRLKGRLELAIAGISDDPESTMDDLIIISGDLLQIEIDHFND